MKTMKKFLATLMAIMMVLSLAACGGTTAETPAVDEPAEAPAADAGNEIVIGATWQDLKNEYIKSLEDVAVAYCAELGVKLISNDGVGDPDTQISQVETFITQGVDAIILNPYDADGCIPAAVKAQEAGIPCIVICTSLSDMSSVTSFVGSNDVVAGQMEAQMIVDAIGGAGNVVILRGPNGISAEINRSEGIFNVLDELSDIEVVFDQTANWDRAEAMSLMENWLQTGTEINGVIAENDEMALGAYNALVAAGKGEIPVVGIDGIPDAYQSISEGGMLATYMQDNVSQSKTAVDVAIKAAKGEAVEVDYDVPFTLVNAENVADFMG